MLERAPYIGLRNNACSIFFGNDNYFFGCFQFFKFFVYQFHVLLLK